MKKLWNVANTNLGATVVGGLIVAVLMGISYSNVWAEMKVILNVLYDTMIEVLNYDIKAWVVILIYIFFVILFFIYEYKVREKQRYEKNIEAGNTRGAIFLLSDDEKLVLSTLKDATVERYYRQDFSENENVKHLGKDKVNELTGTLMRYKLLTIGANAIHGNFYLLTERGRDYVAEHFR